MHTRDVRPLESELAFLPSTMPWGESLTRCPWSGLNLSALLSTTQDPKLACTFLLSSLSPQVPTAHSTSSLCLPSTQRWPDCSAGKPRGVSCSQDLHLMLLPFREQPRTEPWEHTLALSFPYRVWLFLEVSTYFHCILWVWERHISLENKSCIT